MQLLHRFMLDNMVASFMARIKGFGCLWLVLHELCIGLVYLIVLSV
jgi:hypothetical protein